VSPALAEPPTEEQPTLPLPLPAQAPAVSAEADALFTDLTAAVRRHQAVAGHRAVPKRPADHALYRLLDELEKD
jgi:hypothetical protein